MRAREARPINRSFRRLRWTLTAAFTAFNLIGLSLLAVLAARTDEHSRQRALYDEMHRRTSVVVSLLYYDHGQLQLDGIRDDDATQGSPEIVVLEQGRQVFTTAHARLHPDLARLRSLAAVVMARDDSRSARQRGTDGRTLDVLASPFYYDDGHVAGAAIAVADPSGGESRHELLVTSLVAGCAVLTLLSLAGGYLLSGQSLRPAVSALNQQERFLADAAHELRTPLTALRLTIDSAAGDPNPEALRRAQRISERMTELVDNLLGRARVMAGAHQVRREALRLDQLVADLVEQEHPEVTVHAEPTVVTADPTLLRLAVRNLVDNALEHGRPPVEVTVSGPQVMVADRGPGLPGQPLFARFATGSPTGNGLGLAIVQWIAQAHKGSIAAEPRDGGGAVFRLRIGDPPPAPKKTLAKRASDGIS